MAAPHRDSYQPWSMDLLVLSMHNFARISDVIATVEGLRHLDFSIIANRRMVKERLQTLGSMNIFSQFKRFPGANVDGMVVYIDLNAPPIDAYISNLYAATDAGAGQNTPAPQGRVDPNIRDASQDSQLSIHRNLDGFLKACSDISVLYTREIFENRHTIVWG